MVVEHLMVVVPLIVEHLMVGRIPARQERNPEMHGAPSPWAMRSMTLAQQQKEINGAEQRHRDSDALVLAGRVQRVRDKLRPDPAVLESLAAALTPPQAAQDTGTEACSCPNIPVPQRARWGLVCDGGVSMRL